MTLSSDFEIQAAQRIRDLESRVDALSVKQTGYTIGDAVGVMRAFPELRGMWAFGSMNESGQALDYSAQGRTLSNTNSVTRGVLASGMPYIIMNGTNQYMARGSEAGLAITGALTLGGWWRANSFSAPVSANTLMAKTALSPNYGYGLDIINQAGPVHNARVFVSGNGTTLFGQNSVPTIAANTWYFICGRYNPSTSLDVIVNDVVTTQTVGVPAAIFNNAMNFAIGELGSAAQNYLAGNATLCFLSTQVIPDDILLRYYRMTRVFFGV